MNFSDGYRVKSEIQLSSNGFTNKNVGTCFQIAWVTSTQIDPDRVDEGAFCHVGKATNDATFLGTQMADKGHKLIWQKSTEWSTTTPKTFDDTKGTAQSRGTIGLVLVPDVSAGAEPNNPGTYLAKGAFMTATWYQPREATSYTEISRFSKNMKLQGYCIEPSTSVMKISPDGEVTLIGAIQLTVTTMAVLGLSASLLAI